MATVWVCNKSQLWLAMWVLRREYVAGRFAPRRSWQAHHKSSLLGMVALLRIQANCLLISEKSHLSIPYTIRQRDFSSSTQAVSMRGKQKKTSYLKSEVLLHTRPVALTTYVFNDIDNNLYLCNWHLLMGNYETKTNIHCKEQTITII